jgi:hypothetical protein
MLKKRYLRCRAEEPSVKESDRAGLVETSVGSESAMVSSGNSIKILIWVIFHQMRLRQRDKISKTFTVVLMGGDFLAVLGATHSVP